MTAINPLIAGNWKMHGLGASVCELEKIASVVGEPASKNGVAYIVVCVPATLIARAGEKCAGTAVGIGGQDCHAEPSGAHTGDISAEMIADAGAGWVIVGHSERRTDHDEKDAQVRQKADAALRAGLTPIVCIGETGAERNEDRTLSVLKQQMDGSLPASGNFVLAYEPVWAIGTGVTPTLEDIAEVHEFVRDYLVSRYGGDGAAIAILYGGSVKPANAKEILAVKNVNGALVGGASLKADDLLAIWHACPA